MAKVLITGVSGQDGSYMADLCISKGHEVYGMVRRTSTSNDINFKHLLDKPKFHLVYGDSLDGFSIDTLVRNINPDYFVNFAAQSFVGCSWDIPEETFLAGAVGVLKCLEAIRKNSPNCRFYNAGSSEQFGDVVYCPQDEKHPFRPRSPYGAAKVAAQALVKVYRESYNLYAIQGMLFNHESERRGEEFVTRKITKGIGRIVRALQRSESFEPIKLGNLDAKRDWSHSQDFVEGVWRMLNQEKYREEVKIPKLWPKSLREYVLSSNETHTVREFIDIALKEAAIEGQWSGTGVDEKFISNGSVIVSVDPKFFRPAEVDILLGDSSLIRKELGWKPNISFENLVKRMVKNDLPHAKEAQGQE